MKAVEVCFNENKLKLEIKLLCLSPYNETYQSLNNNGQNLFHILAKKGIHQVYELNKFLDILFRKKCL